MYHHKNLCLSKLSKTVYNWVCKANICVDVDFYDIYLKKNNLIERNLISYLKNIFRVPSLPSKGSNKTDDLVNKKLCKSAQKC